MGDKHVPNISMLKKIKSFDSASLSLAVPMGSFLNITFIMDMKFIVTATFHVVYHNEFYELLSKYSSKLVAMTL